MTKLFSVLAIVGLATTVSAKQTSVEVSSVRVKNAAKADMSSSKDGSTEVSSKAKNGVKNSESIALSASVSKQVYTRAKNTLSSKATPVQKGDSVSSSDATKGTFTDPVKDAGTSLKGTTNAAASSSEATSKSETIKLAGEAVESSWGTTKSGASSFGRGVKKVAESLYNSLSVSVQGSTNVSSAVSKNQDTVAASSEVTSDSSDALSSQEAKVKELKLKYKYLAMVEAQENDWNQGRDFQQAFAEYTSAARDLTQDRSFGINEALASLNELNVMLDASGI